MSCELASVTSSGVGSATVALGNTWSHCVNTRLIVQYVDETHRQVYSTFNMMYLSTSVSLFVEDCGLSSQIYGYG